MVVRTVPSELLFTFGPLAYATDVVVIRVCLDRLPPTGGGWCGNGGGSKNLFI